MLDTGLARLLKYLFDFSRSFSFRIGLIIFLVFCLVLISLRIGLYKQSIRDEENDIKQLIQAHFVSLYESYEQHGEEYTIELLNELVKDAHDPHLVLAIKHNDEIFGNLKNLPPLPNVDNKWVFLDLIKLKYENGINMKLKVRFMAKIVHLAASDTLVVAYDINRLEYLKDNLFKSVVIDIEISILSSFILSSLIVFVLNRYHRRFNLAYAKIKSGNLSYRIKTKNSNDQFENLSKNFNSMMNWVEALLNTIKDTTNSIAHDLRTPLSRHRIGLETIIKKHNLDEKTSEDIRRSISEVDNIIKMFSSILVISKAEGKSGIEHFKKLEINEILENLIEFFEPLAEEKNIHLNLSLTPEKLYVNGDKQLLTQGVFNLIDNAIKYNKKHSIVTVTLRKEKNNIIISVADNGEGVAEENLEKIKEKFFRIDKSRTTTGTGLGLSLVDAVAKLHNGRLLISNNNPGLKAEIILSI